MAKLFRCDRCRRLFESSTDLVQVEIPSVSVPSNLKYDICIEVCHPILLQTLSPIDDLEKANLPSTGVKL